MSVYYGYAVDLADLDSEVADTLTESSYTHTCYSVSSYEPTMAVFGIELDRSGFLFNPVSLRDLKLAPTEKQVKELEKALAALPEDARETLTGTPDVFMFETTDD
jgi:hypothetical protein